MACSLTIGEVAKTSGVAAKTIRYYEQIGVLPAPSRAASGYRLYDQPGVERLRFIRRARSLGLSLHQLKTLMGTFNAGPCPTLRPRLRALVRGQLDAVTNRMSEHGTESGALPTRHPGACQCLETENGRARRRRREARPSVPDEASP